MCAPSQKSLADRLRALEVLIFLELLPLLMQSSEPSELYQDVKGFFLELLPLLSLCEQSELEQDIEGHFSGSWETLCHERCMIMMSYGKQKG